MKRRLSAILALAASLCAGAAQARTICTVMADAADGTVLLQQGDCTTRVTPASTFKIPLALMGFDSGFLKDAGSPALPFRAGDPAWGGDEWRQPTGPARWMKYSVVWYSQRIAATLGAESLHDQAARFGFGNADFSGDPGRNNGLERAWISSSLKISPLEQVAFLRKLVNRKLPVTAHAFDQTDRIVEVTRLADDWDVHGKTGTAFPRRADSTFDEARAYGWFVGWAVRGNRKLVFARLDQDEKKEARSGGLRARDGFLEAFPALLAAAAATDSHLRSWPEQKCAIYKDASARLFAAKGKQGLGPDFLKAHEAFLTSGCTERRVCPRSTEELAAANTLTILAMNAKMASTFLPFACGK